MTRSRLRRRLPALGVFALLIAVPAAAVDPDLRVRDRLKEKGTPYVIDEDGDYRIVVEWPDSGRTQIVWVFSQVNDVRGLQVREVQSQGFRSADGPVPYEVALAMLADGQRRVIGGWVTQSNDSVGTFVVKIPADADADTLDTAIDVVAVAADGLEQRFTGDEDAL